jgi:hypothetical protein
MFVDRGYKWDDHMQHIPLSPWKGTISERKLSYFKIEIVGRNSFAALDMLEVLHVGVQIAIWNSIHAFIELSMFGNFDMSQFDIIPKNVFSGLVQKPKKSTVVSVNG